jgi:hypothetical protein
VTEAAVQLVLVSNPLVNSQEDFNQLAQLVREVDPTVHTHIALDVNTQVVPWLRPSITVSPAPLRHFRPQRGPVFQGLDVPKSQEYLRLEQVHVPVPQWTVLHRDTPKRLDGFGPYVVTKPEYGARGADVRIRRAERARWTPPTTAYALTAGGPSNPLIAQRFIHTGPWPTSVRVVTLFGEVLFALQIEANRAKAPLHHSADLARGGYSIVSSGRGCTFALCDDEAILNLARRAHDAFPDVPLLGIDIVREVTTSNLYVLEANSLGYTWHFSSSRGLAIQQEFQLDLDSQFGGRLRAAQRLARICRERAT